MTSLPHKEQIKNLAATSRIFTTGLDFSENGVESLPDTLPLAFQFPALKRLIYVQMSSYQDECFPRRGWESVGPYSNAKINPKEQALGREKYLSVTFLFPLPHFL